MRRGKPWKLLDLVVILLVVLGGRQLTQADGVGTVAGSIAGGAGARITVVCGSTVRSMTATAAGTFAIGGLPAGSCTVTATAAGKPRAVATITIRAGSTTAVRLALSEPDKNQPVEAESKPGPRPRPPPHRRPRPSMKPAASPIAIAQPIMADDDGHDTEAYDRIDDNPFHRVATRPLSTFSVDVDTASYSNVRRFLGEGRLPPKDAVRVEELINYFSYAYPAPAKHEPFSITTDVTDSPWNAQLKLVRIGLAAPAIHDAQVPPRNLVFLLDVSGSMSSPAKLPLLKQAMNLLVAQLRPQDTIAIVTYAGSAGLALPATSGKEKDAIRNAIFRLESGGSTNGAAGIQLAYNIAEKQKRKGSINRVILATDGDFNVGPSSEGELTRLIEQERARGVFLTVLGFGMGNLKDSTMEKLADRGNGNYAYIDSISEARKVLVKEAGATLVTVAKDVKLQVEFNPAVVAGYRLIGYENRMLRDQDFNDDKKDAGDIGAGHSVTALYEIVPAGVAVPSAKVDALKYQRGPSLTGRPSQELLTVKVRYKAPNGDTSKLLSRAVKNESVALAQASIDVRWATAIAGFGMMLRDAPNRGNLTWKQVEVMARAAIGPDAEGYRAQAVRLIEAASKLKR